MTRRILFWSHLVVGLVAGAFIFILCLTGAIIAFEHQIVDWAERTARALPPSDTSSLLPPSELVAAAAKIEPSKATHIEWFADPRMPVRIRYPEQRVVLINGYTGEVLGRGATKTRSFLRWNLEVHTGLLAGAAGH